MALIQSVMTPTGKATFWILGTTWRDNFNKTAFISIYGFESQEHCDFQGTMYKDKKTYNIGPLEFDNYFNLQELKEAGKCDLDQYYKYIKATDPNFTFSEDYIVSE